jgi:predicted membrane protein
MCAAPSSSRNSGLWIGLIVVLIGLFLFIDQLDLLIFPQWLFSWEMLLIVIGLLIGIRSNFKSVGWLVLVLLGSFFLLDEVPGFSYIRPYSLPMGIIIIGLFLIVRSATRPTLPRQGHANDEANSDTARVTEFFSSSKQTRGTGSAEDYVDLTSFFGGIKRRIFSKSFKGGKTTNVFGGIELDLTQADVEDSAVLDMVQIFGGVKLIVPSNWEVRADNLTILGGLDDKRKNPDVTGSGKKLFLTGTSIFSGIEIKSY